MVYPEQQEEMQSIPEVETIEAVQSGIEEINIDNTSQEEIQKTQKYPMPNEYTFDNIDNKEE